MSKTIIFIHGMFLNHKSWENWVSHFEAKGYTCIAEPWPFHEGDPAQLRNSIPEGLGELPLQTVIDKYADLAAAQTEKPILIGHSIGGLIVQSLVNKQLASLGVCLSSVAPNAMISFDWGLMRNTIMIGNPLKGDDPYMMDVKGFHQNFCNTMTMEETEEAYNKYAVHESRNVFRDALQDAGKVDLEFPHVPLLFITGDKDEIIPHELVEKNSKAYKDEDSSVTFKEFTNRGHFIYGQPGWQEVLAYTDAWIEQVNNNTTASVVSTSIV